MEKKDIKQCKQFISSIDDVKKDFDVYGKRWVQWSFKDEQATRLWI
jgi:hypothetical protein